MDLCVERQGCAGKESQEGCETVREDTSEQPAPIVHWGELGAAPGGKRVWGKVPALCSSVKARSARGRKGKAVQGRRAKKAV